MILRGLIPRGLLVTAFLVTVTRPGRAQRPADWGDWEASHAQLSRPALQDLLRRLDESADSSAQSNTMRNQARTAAASLRARLSTGDFKVGDRIYLLVEGERPLTDTFTVGPGTLLTLPIVGETSVAGVLHSELESHLRSVIGGYLRDPTVHVRSLIRIAVLGEVTRPGFYTVTTQMLVTDALMLAGGPTHGARINDLRIMRGEVPVWEGTLVRQAVAAGRTLDELSLVAGDRIEVPSRGARFFGGHIMTALSMLVALPGAVYGISRLFH